MAYYNFKTPTVSEGPIGGHRLFYFRKQNKGITVIKTNGSYSTVRYSLDEDLADYDVVYRGGYNHTVDDSTKAELIAAGIGVTEANFTAL